MARFLVLLVILSATWAWGHAVAPPCTEVMGLISPCMEYLSGRAWAPYGPCCGGITALNRTASTRVDRVAICSCLKSIAPRFPGVGIPRATTLPHLCGVLINVNISASMDCNSIPAQ